MVAHPVPNAMDLLGRDVGKIRKYRKIRICKRSLKIAKKARIRTGAEVAVLVELEGRKSMAVANYSMA